MLVLFVRTGEDNWEINSGSGRMCRQAFMQLVYAHEQLQSVPWVVIICLESGAIESSEYMSYWTMVPGSVPLNDSHMLGFILLAKRKKPRGRFPWSKSPTGTAVFEENRLDTINWPEPTNVRTYWEVMRIRRPWWTFWS